MRKFEESLFPNDTNNALRKRGTPERSVKIASSLAYNTSTIYIRAIIGDLRIYQKFLNLGLFFGAGDRFRTDDLVLGKHTLYQLSYTRSPVRPVRTRSSIGRRGACQIAAQAPSTVGAHQGVLAGSASRQRFDVSCLASRLQILK
jgi:hypothetical protein